MVNYQHGKVYKITSNHTELVYIGSTCNPLRKRLAKHRDNYRRHLAGNYGKVSSFDILQHGDAIIVLVEDCPCDNKEQLFRRERYHIENTPNCINMRVPGRTAAEHYQANKAAMAEKDKLYRETNKEVISERGKLYYEDNKDLIMQKTKAYREANKGVIAARRNHKCECPCGGKYTFSGKSQHYNSAKHQAHLAQAKRDNEWLDAFARELGL